MVQPDSVDRCEALPDPGSGLDDPRSVLYAARTIQAEQNWTHRD